MDVLLSVPFLASYLFSPGLTSWSTSLNLLFFYMTWTTLVLSHSPLRVRVTGTLAIRLVLWLVPSLLSLALDVAVPSLSRGLKYGGRSALPPRDARKLARVGGLALANLAAVTLLEAAMSLASTYALGEPDFKTSTTLPLPWQMAKHLLLLLTAREVLHYYLHRFVLHGRSLLARQHTHCAHSRAGPSYSLQLFADHPLTFLLHRFVPLYLPALLLRPHLLTYFLLVALCTAEETLALSGYSIVPGIVMGGLVQRASVHYASRGAYNFGSWGLLDWAHGTNRGRDLLDDIKGEAEKHRVKERASRSMSRSTSRKVGEGRSAVSKSIKKLQGDSSARKSSRKRSTKKTE